MRKTLAIAVALIALGCNKPGGGGASGRAPTTEDDKTFYALGLSLGRGISVFNLNKDELEMVQRGLADQVQGKEPLVPLETYGMKLQELARQRQGQRAEQEKAKSKPFLEKAEKEPGAVKLPSGLIYKEISPGTGAEPAPSDVVKVNYKGTLTDGKEFDSSYKRGQPAQFPLSGVIPCWTEGVQKMKVGGKAQLICPSNLAYGDRGAPPNIPGGATLIFEVELLEIVKQPPPPPGMPGMPGQLPPGHPTIGGATDAGTPTVKLPIRPLPRPLPGTRDAGK